MPNIRTHTLPSSHPLYYHNPPLPPSYARTVVLPPQAFSREIPRLPNKAYCSCVGRLRGGRMEGGRRRRGRWCSGGGSRGKGSLFLVAALLVCLWLLRGCLSLCSGGDRCIGSLEVAVASGGVVVDVGVSLRLCSGGVVAARGEVLSCRVDGPGI